jgi:hypothetical protein
VELSPVSTPQRREQASLFKIAQTAVRATQVVLHGEILATRAPEFTLSGVVPTAAHNLAQNVAAPGRVKYDRPNLINDLVGSGNTPRRSPLLAADGSVSERRWLSLSRPSGHPADGRLASLMDETQEQRELQGRLPNVREHAEAGPCGTSLVPPGPSRPRHRESR